LIYIKKTRVYFFILIFNELMAYFFRPVERRQIAFANLGHAHCAALDPLPVSALVGENTAQDFTVDTLPV
jgi:hypothetical protein